MQSQIGIAVLASLLVVQPLAAKEIKLPDGTPQVSLDIPDDWTVSFDQAGLQATSPEANSFVFGKILKRPADDPNAWVSAVLAKLQARGVTFKTTDVAAVTVPPSVPATASVAAPPTNAAQDLPAVSSRSIESSDHTSQPPPALSVPSLALLNEGIALPAAPHKGPQFPFHALPYKGTSLNGKPVDVELLTSIHPDKSVFFLIQESGQTDPRIADIVASVKPPR